MSLQHLGKGALRVAKNYTKGYSDTQSKVRDATSNDPWGPSGTQMNEIAQLTYNQQDFVEIMEMLDRRLNDKGKNWRHVFKALTVLDYCLHAGSENVVLYFRDNMYIIKTLKEFQYVDEDMKDQGANVRQKAKDITNLLQDESRLREQRRSRAHMRDRLVGNLEGAAVDEDLENENVRRRSRSVPPGGSSKRRKDEEDLKKAIENSKRTLADEQARLGQMTAEERDLATALRLSQDEEAKRLKAIEESNSRALFDEGTQLAGPSASNNPFPLIDATSVPSNPMQLQPQFTSANPYFQQQQQMAQQQAQQQAEYEWMLQQQQAQAQAQAQAQQQQMQEEWMRQQQLVQQQQLYVQQQQQQQAQLQQQLQLQQQQQTLFSPAISVQPTGYGSNNPFAMSGTGGGSAPSPFALGGGAGSSSGFGGLSGMGGLSSPAPQNTQRAPSPAPIAQQNSPTMANTLANARRPDPKSDGEHAHLATLFANREDGVDSFGNFGNLRFGHAYAGQLNPQPTGSSNPFMRNPNQPPQQQNEQPFFSV